VFTFLSLLYSFCRCAATPQHNTFLDILPHTAALNSPFACSLLQRRYGPCEADALKDRMLLAVVSLGAPPRVLRLPPLPTGCDAGHAVQAGADIRP
jgi:hypothetical protein